MKALKDMLDRVDNLRVRKAKIEALMSLEGATELAISANSSTMQRQVSFRIKGLPNDIIEVLEHRIDAINAELLPLEKLIDLFTEALPK